MDIRNEQGIFELREVIGLINDIRSGTTRMLVGLNHPARSSGLDIDRVFEAGIFENRKAFMDFFDYTEMNASDMKPKQTELAQQIAREYNLSLVCSTDAHRAPQVGRHYTKTSQSDIHEAILKNDLRIPESFSRSHYWSAKLWRFVSGAKKRILKAINRKKQKNV